MRAISLMRRRSIVRSGRSLHVVARACRGNLGAMSAPPRRAAEGDLATYTRQPFRHERFQHDVYRKGSGPAVLVLTELPNISPQVLGFADRLVALGFSATLPDFFGRPGEDPDGGSGPARAGRMVELGARLCVSREFRMFASGQTSPVVGWLRALAKLEHDRCGGPGVGVVGMCFSGGFALAMAADPRVLVPVLSQPSLPIGLTARQRASIDCDPAELEQVRERCAGQGLQVLGLRFEGDPLVPAARFSALRERLGDGFIAVEIAQRHGHPEDAMRRHHSVLTRALIDQPGEPTREALDRVLALLQSKLLPAQHGRAARLGG
jgi:dienelactone hydrolase